MRELNLARRPFVNLKPVRRAGLLVLVVAIALTAVNAVLYWRHFSGESKTRGRSQELTRQIGETEAEVAELRRRIGSLDIEALNRRARYVNLEIDRRGFSWSRLFDRLVETQPGSVRLVSMSPQFAQQARRRRRQMATDQVMIELNGVARNGEAILEFIDGLFRHPAFRDPDLSRETARENGTLAFDLDVMYLPNSEDPPAPAGEETGTVDEAVDEAAEESAEDGQGDTA